MSEIFSEKVIGGRRTYFFDVKETKDGVKYLVIGEVTQVGDDLDRHRVMVFEENLDSFCAGLEKAADFIGANARARDGRFERRQEVCPQCGGEIAPDDDEALEMLDRIERKVDEIRSHFR